MTETTVNEREGRFRDGAVPAFVRRFRLASFIAFIGFFVLAAKIGFHLIDELKAKDFDIRQAKRDEKREEFYRIGGRR